VFYLMIMSVATALLQALSRLLYLHPVVEVFASSNSDYLSVQNNFLLYRVYVWKLRAGKQVHSRSSNEKKLF